MRLPGRRFARPDFWIFRPGYDPDLGLFPAGRVRCRSFCSQPEQCAYISPGLGNQAAMVTFIIVLIIIGLIAGLIARLLVPGKDPIGILGTIILGVVGSFIGGFVENLIQYHSVSVNSFHATGIIGSIIGAIILLLILRVTGTERGRSRRRR
jgi:uncharacterized membrane protein YeaQ/YmgE (transglycosylase-associated protein family)